MNCGGVLSQCILELEGQITAGELAREEPFIAVSFEMDSETRAAFGLVVASS